ncbi:MAG: hypothetical protein Q8T08_19010 [Ignavibacteria bacterium]|nr:hypothetical protein [Ignavibacteria bacterium]
MDKNKNSNLEKQLNKIKPEISIDVNAIATYYPGMIKVYIPNTPINKTLSDWEAQTSPTLTAFESKTSNETSLERSIRRSQKLVSDYVRCNWFDLFATITIATDRYNTEHSKKKLLTWLKNQRDRNGKFRYIIVSEFHKDGALHFHVLLANYNGKLKRSINPKTGHGIISNGKPVFELSEYKSGFTKVQEIGQTVEDQAKVGRYISKYITKEMVSIFGKKRFWTSKGLKKPIQEDNPQWYMDIKPDDIYENDYGKIYTYTNLDNSLLPPYVKSYTEIKQP